MTIRIHSLYTYPIKSCRGYALDSAELVDTGFRHDRHWMLVNAQGEFLSQRQLPAMARIATRLAGDSLLVQYDSSDDELAIPLQQADDDYLQVQIWNDRCLASRVSAQASEWFSDKLNTQCELVYLPLSQQRQVDPRYANNEQIVGFADGFPILVMSMSTADLLAEKLGEPVDIKRFRPNIVLSGCPAHREDDWASISIGDLVIDLVKPCSRCVIPSIDQSSGEKHPELLRELAAYRRQNGKIYVGQNGLHRKNGKVQVGDQVSIQPK